MNTQSPFTADEMNENRRAEAPLAGDGAGGVAPAGAEMITMVNDLNIGADGWAQIAPFGDFAGMAIIPDGRGGHTRERAIQRLDKLAVAEMANEYRQNSRGLSGFFKKRPIYDGHPDSPLGGDRYPNKLPVGIFNQVAAREDGFFGEPILTEEGEALIASRQRTAFSGRWHAEYVGVENGLKVFRPVKFLSAGLTDHPNLPVQLLNEAEVLPDGHRAGRDSTHTPDSIIMNKITAWLARHGITIANEATEEQVEAALARLDPQLAGATTLANDLHALQSAAAEKDEQIRALNRRTAEAQASFANERRARVNELLGAAINSGRITAAERPAWEARLNQEATFANEAGALGRLPARIKVTRVTDPERGNAGADISNAQERIARVQELVQAEMRQSGLNYPAAWAKIQREHPALFAAMKGPGAR